MRKLAILVLLLTLIVSTTLVGTVTWGDDVQDAKIGIVPAASGSPAKYANLFVEDMVTRGLDESQVVILPLALKDDSKTPDINESLWSNNGNSSEVVQMVENLTGIWFVGGDQLRITEILINSDGSNTPVLKEIWKVYNKGGVIGGSSAGAAIMSELMIAGGDSLNALRHGYTEDFDTASMDYQNEGGLVVTEGLGFFSHGIVDQHFDRKARLGRLVVTAYDNKAIWSHAYGVEENTALIYDGQSNKISVAGTGGVVVLDMTYAEKNFGYTGIKVSYLEGSGQAALTMPLMAPLDDLLGVSKQVAVLAFQLGDGFTNLIVPTSGCLMGVLGVARLDWNKWFKFQWKFQALLFGLGSVFVIIAVAIGWS